MTKDTTIKLTVELPVTLFRAGAFPLPYHEIGDVTYEGRRTRMGISINQSGAYLFIDQQVVSLRFEDLANLIIPQLLKLPHDRKYITGTAAEDQKRETKNQKPKEAR